MSATRNMAVLGYFHGPKLGVGVFMDRLMAMLAQDVGRLGRVVFYTNKNTLDNFSASLDGIEVRQPWMLNHGSVMSIVWSALVFPIVCMFRGMQATLILANPIVVLPVVRTVSVICDVSEFEIVDKYGPLRTFYRKHIMLASAVRFSRRLVVISNFVREQLQRYFSIAEEKQVDVVPLGVDMPVPTPELVAEALARRSLKYEGYYLIVGRLDPRGKNLDSALKLYRWLEEHKPGQELVLVGGINESTRREAEAFLDRIKGDAWLSRRVRYLGFVDDDELSALYSAATATIFFSRVEGFGLPLTEAFKSGCPVIYHDNCAVIRDHSCGAAIGVNESMFAGRVPKSVVQIFDPAARANLKQRMISISSRYTWESCWQQYADILESELGR